VPDPFDLETHDVTLRRRCRGLFHQSIIVCVTALSNIHTSTGEQSSAQRAETQEAGCCQPASGLALFRERPM
jgi:hypothetical protein